jgi:two-component system, OmpR family, heavy metal sensor histidine kinase CusS
MPSIRQSLIAYFLLLLGAALASVAVLYDRLASEAVEERKHAELKLIEQKLENRSNDAIEKFDSELLLHAKALARDVRQKYFLLANRPPDQNFLRRFQTSMGVAPLGQGLSGWQTAFSVIATNHPGFRNSVFWNFLAPPSLDEAIRQSLEQDDHSGVFQIHVPRMAKPISPYSQPLILPIDLRLLDKEGSFTEEYFRIDEVEVLSDAVYRRVVYRPPFWTMRVPRPNSGSPRTDGPRSEGRPGGSPRPPTTSEFQSVYVQYARKKTELEAIRTEHKETALAERAVVIENTAARLKWLRTWLVTIGLIAFVAMVAGGWILIGRGLAPLAHLSEAVSRVSPTDFRLPVEPGELSQELLPIHARLTQTLDALRRAFEREKQSVADISHELRTPLASLQTTIDVCLRKPRENEKYRETLQECRMIGQQLNRLVTRILTLANLDAGNDRTHRVDVELDTLVKECAAVIRPLAASHELQLETDVQPGITLNTDPDKLREVLMNLLHNAIEYNRTGGQVKLHSFQDPVSKMIVIEVSDSGIGMTPEVTSHIFERFYRADASRTATGIHAGLGLSIVKEYVSLLNGNIDVESTPNVGSSFRVKLPGQANVLEPAKP